MLAVGVVTDRFHSYKFSTITCGIFSVGGLGWMTLVAGGRFCIFTSARAHTLDPLLSTGKHPEHHQRVLVLSLAIPDPDHLEQLLGAAILTGFFLAASQPVCLQVCAVVVFTVPCGHSLPTVCWCFLPQGA